MQVLSLDARGGGWKASVLWAGRYGRAVFQTASTLAGNQFRQWMSQTAAWMSSMWDDSSVCAL